MAKDKKIRVNISVDKSLIDKAKKKIEFFGGKLSTLFNAFLKDFTNTIGNIDSNSLIQIKIKIDEFDQRLKKIETQLR